MDAEILNLGQAWWYIAVIPPCRKLRRDDCEFEASLRYIVRPHFKKQKKKERKIKKREKEN
jgi:hypothetical protein